MQTGHTLHKFALWRTFSAIALVFYTGHAKRRQRAFSCFKDNAAVHAKKRLTRTSKGTALSKPITRTMISSKR